MEASSYPGVTAWFAVPTVTHVPKDEAPQRRSATLASYVHVQTGPEVEDRLRERGYWVGAHLRTGLTLPSNTTMVRFEGAEMLICPSTAELLPVIFYRTNREALRDSQRLIQRFVSSLNWMNASFGTIQLEWSAGSRPTRHGNRAPGIVLTHSFYQEWLPQNLGPDQRLALALYREGSSISHAGYQFLSFYKVINLKYRNGQSQKAWIASKLAMIEEDRAKKRLAKLRAELATDEAIAAYLHVSCRCAVAHASVDQPTVDPEDPEDQARLERDLPLIRALAEHLIRTEFRIPNRADVWKKNVLALEGARLLMGQEICDRIALRELVFRSEIRLPRAVDVKVWGKPQLRAFQAMHLHTYYSDDGSVTLRLSSQGDAVTVWVVLDFAANKVHFDPLMDVQCDDDGSARAADEIADASQLQRDVFGNGMIEVWDCESCLCITQGDAYLPLNMFLDYEKSEAELHRLRELAAQRRELESSKPGLHAGG
jgi:hypothetical protein